MSSVVLAHVDDLGSFLGTAEGSLDHSLRFTYEGDDGAVGGFTRIHVEQFNTLY